MEREWTGSGAHAQGFETKTEEYCDTIDDDFVAEDFPTGGEYDGDDGAELCDVGARICDGCLEYCEDFGGPTEGAEECEEWNDDCVDTGCSCEGWVVEYKKILWDHLDMEHDYGDAVDVVTGVAVDAAGVVVVLDETDAMFGCF